LTTLVTAWERPARIGQRAALSARCNSLPGSGAPLFRAPARTMQSSGAAPMSGPVLAPLEPNTASSYRVGQAASSAKAGGVPSRDHLPPRGAFICFEGVDRCGKTTQTTRLVEHLTSLGCKAELWRFPDRTTEIGKMINAYLSSGVEMDDACIHLLFSANRWEKRAALLQKLSQGVTVVADRYAFSGVAFTSAKETPGLTRDWCSAPDQGLVAPDVVVYLDVPQDVAAARGCYGGERYERREMQERVAREFEAMSSRVADWEVLDACRDIDAIHEDIKAIAARAVEACRQGRPLRRLWDYQELELCAASPS